jgi:two-component system, cell cycle sensor histidine kinase and response regulator CckA
VTKPRIRILVIDDNSDDFLILKTLFSKIDSLHCTLENSTSLAGALKQLALGGHDVYLVDYRLGPDLGLEFLKQARAAKCKAPVILLTGLRTADLDLEALEMGAADFLSKNKLEPGLLERAIRYALERQKSQEALRESEEFFRAVTENALDGIAILAGDGAVRYLSPSVKRILGYQVEELTGKSLFLLLHEEDEPRVRNMLDYLLKARGRSQTIEIQVKHREGTWRTLEAMAQSHVFQEPFLDGIVVNYRDVTGRKRAERTTSRLATIVESSEDAIYSLTLDGVILSWNPGAEKIYGYTPSEAGGRDIALVVPPGQLEEFSRMLEIVRDGRAVTNIVARHQTKKGEDIPLSMTLSPIKNAMGQVTSASVVARDITESEKAKAVQDMLQAERDQLLERMQLQMENMPIACTLMDENFNITYANPTAEKTFGYPFKDLEGRNPADIIAAPEDKPSLLEWLDKLKTGRKGAQEVRVLKNLRQDGKTILCEWHKTPLHDSDGGFLGIISMGIDVTERQKAEEVSSQLAAILQQTTDAVIGSDLDGDIFSWNHGAETMLGYRLEEIAGQNTALLVPPDRKEEMEKVRELATKDENISNYETILLKKDGGQVEVSVTVSPIKDTRGKIIGVSAISRDITERKKAEESLRKHEEQMRLVEKMNAIGRLAGGVAHDFNNLLSVIGGNAEFLLSSMEKENPHREEVEEVQKAVKRGAELTKQLLVFGKKQVSQPQPVNLNEVSGELNRMLKRVIDATVDLAIIQDPKLRPVMADPGQMQQVIMNLALNARDAMPQGGNLIIETKQVEPEDLDQEKDPTIPPGSYARLSVTDTGMGMDEEVQKRIFEPFFTTKAGKGTGLGLASVYGIVNQWKGHIALRSRPGRGATFSVYFPALATAEGPAAKPKQMSLISQGSETVLVSEDEEPVRKILVRTLEKYGYKVLEAPNGIEALQKAWGYRDPIHLLLTDTVMPKMNGKVLADELKKTRPKLKVLFISGYPKEILSQQGILDPGIHLIQKPFELDDLVQQVRKILDEK